MIIRNLDDVTVAVLRECSAAADPRLAQLLCLFVEHIHRFVREAKLSEDEFRLACSWIARLGQQTTADHNEVVLMAGSLGLSTLVCLLNNGNGGQTETTANLLGPFWRLGSPPTADGASIVRSPTPGVPLLVTVNIVDRNRVPVVGALVDVWHAAADGFYENQDPSQADMNLRGQFRTDDLGTIHFRTIKPAGYPIPVNGVVGALLRTLGRHNMRPAHLHFLVAAAGFKTHIAQVYAADDPFFDSDVQFGVTQALLGRIEGPFTSAAPDTEVHGEWFALHHTLTLDPGEMRLPQPPITGKSAGTKPALEILARRASGAAADAVN